MSERGQISVAAVAAVTLLLMGGVLVSYLSMLATGGGHAQRAADLAAIAAAKELGARPDASAATLRRKASVAAGANDGRLVSLRVERAGPVPRTVDVSVAVAVSGSVPVAGRQRRSVAARARAGVAYAASLAPGVFRPVDLHGGRGAPAAVAAAEAQVGWPYVWGGESRAEGGFDCSGLVDYAYAAAGAPLPGRPTAADLWRLGRPEAAADLAPADLVFVGAADGAPHHVGMYVGGGMVVVAPHTGAQVRYEPLAAGGWDGFARLMSGAGGAEGGPDPAVEAAARARQVPPHMLAAELQLGLAADPGRAAAVLAAAMRRHPGDLPAALADALGDPSAAALVLRRASGPALGDGFSASVRLLPVPEPAATVGVPPGAAARGAPVRSSGGSGGGLSGILGALGDGIEGSAAQLEHLGGRMSVQAAAALRNLLRFGITGAAAFLPNPHWQNLAALAGAVWDGVGSAFAVVDGGFSLSGASLWAARLTTPFGLGFAGLFAWQAWAARRREDRIWYAAQAASSALTAAGAMTAGADLVAMGAATAEVPPLGAALMLAGVTVLAGACAYRERRLLSAGVRGAWSGVTGAARAGAGWVGGKAARAAGAVVDAGRSLAGAINPF